MDQTSVTAIILSTVREFNQGVAADQRISEAPEAMLFGRRGTLDSFGLVDFILMLEERIKTSYGVTLTLADERAVTQEKSPFRSVSSLAEYIEQLLGREVRTTIA